MQIASNFDLLRDSCEFVFLARVTAVPNTKLKVWMLIRAILLKQKWIARRNVTNE